MTHEPPPWLDDFEPHEPDVSERQIAALRAQCTAIGRAHVLDVGAGAGRIAAPLCKDGHAVVAMDHSSHALQRCMEACGDTPCTVVEADFRQPWPSAATDAGPYDLILCLGNTFMLLHELDEAIAFLSQCASSLKPGGSLLLDDLPREFWPELAEGLWQAGVSADEQLQLVWAPDDAVFTLRMGDQVDDKQWAIGADEPHYRLWTHGLLDAVARCAGLSVTVRAKTDGLFELHGRSDASK